MRLFGKPFSVISPPPMEGLRPPHIGKHLVGLARITFRQEQPDYTFALSIITMQAGGKMPEWAIKGQ
jgi:hypothetical protein